MCLSRDFKSKLFGELVEIFICLHNKIRKINKNNKVRLKGKWQAMSFKCTKYFKES